MTTKKPYGWLMITPSHGNKIFIDNEADYNRFAAMDGRQFITLFTESETDDSNDSNLVEYTAIRLRGILADLNLYTYPNTSDSDLVSGLFSILGSLRYKIKELLVNQK